MKIFVLSQQEWLHLDFGQTFKKILGMPMIEHVYIRAKFYKRWEKLFIAGCDPEIKFFVIIKIFHT